MTPSPPNPLVAIEELSARMLEMEARTMALVRFVSVHLSGGDPQAAARIFTEIEASKRKIHEQLLTLAENSDPGGAAKLDKRPQSDVE